MVQQFLKKIRISTVITLGLLVLAFTFALMGFINARNLYIAPSAITIYMMISSGLFAILAVRALGRREMWQRFLGVAAIVASIYMIVFAIIFFTVLRHLVAPEF